MEVLVVAIGVGFLVFVAIGARRGPRSDQSRNTLHPPVAQDEKLVRLRAPTSARPKPKPFDQSEAHKVKQPVILEGRAWVIDGDSIVINKTQVRLFGIDAPELDHPFGKRAKWAMVNLCKGQDIRAEVTEIDAHGRTVAKCTLPDGRDLSAELVKAGLAIDWPKFSGGKYRALEVPGARRKMWLADARQKGRMHVWRQFEARKAPSD